MNRIASRTCGSLSDEIEFFVSGEPQQAGSKKWVPRKGRPGARPIIIDDNPDAAMWMNIVGSYARVAMNRRKPWTGPLEFDMRFYMPRPRTVTKEKRLYPTVAPDTTKLVRCAEDALKKIVWIDDAQVVSQRAVKVYADDHKPGVHIIVRRCIIPNQ